MLTQCLSHELSFTALGHGPLGRSPANASTEQVIFSADELKMRFFPKPAFHPAFWVRKPASTACISNWSCNGDVTEINVMFPL